MKMVFADPLFQNKWTEPWPFCLSVLRFWLVRDQFGPLVFPPGDLCVSWVRAVMTWVNDIECQSLLIEHMGQLVTYEGMCV